MENLNKWNCLTYLGVARELRVTIWRLRYAVESRYLPPPSVVLKRRPLFSPDQVAEMKRYFEKEESHRRDRGRVEASCQGQ
jgi:hypothetical protein